MTDKVKKAIEQLERVSNSLASIGETVDYTDTAIQALEQISHLKGRPCESCEFHTEKGCSRWECVFEEVNADKGVLEKINEKQDSLRATCKAWDEAIQKDGYVD